MNRGLLALVLALALAAAASWLLLRREEQMLASPAGAQPLEPGYYLLDATLVGLDREGRMGYTLHAARIEQHADEDIRLSGVQLDYAPAPETPWILVADSGRLRDSGERLEFEGHVRLTRADQPPQEAWQVDTERLELELDRRIARTAAAVSVTRAGHSLTAVGLEAQLDREWLRLQSNVRGRFQPDRS